MKNDEELLQKAIAQYRRWCERNGYIVEQPSIYCSRVGRRYVYLANNYRELAKFPGHARWNRSAK